MRLIIGCSVMSTAVITLYMSVLVNDYMCSGLRGWFGGSESRLQFSDVPLMHAVMSDQLV